MFVTLILGLILFFHLQTRVAILSSWLITILYLFSFNFNVLGNQAWTKKKKICVKLYYSPQVDWGCIGWMNDFHWLLTDSKLALLPIITFLFGADSITAYWCGLQRNYRFFFMFISTATILCVYVFVFSWIHIVSRKEHVLKAISQDILSDFLIVYCFIAVWFVGGLTIFHSYLICTNQVTILTL